MLADNGASLPSSPRCTWSGAAACHSRYGTCGHRRRAVVASAAPTLRRFFSIRRPRSRIRPRCRPLRRVLTEKRRHFVFEQALQPVLDAWRAISSIVSQHPLDGALVITWSMEAAARARSIDHAIRVFQQVAGYSCPERLCCLLAPSSTLPRFQSSCRNPPWTIDRRHDPSRCRLIDYPRDASLAVAGKHHDYRSTRSTRTRKTQEVEVDSAVSAPCSSQSRTNVLIEVVGYVRTSAGVRP